MFVFKEGNFEKCKLDYYTEIHILVISQNNDCNLYITRINKTETLKKGNNKFILCDMELSKTGFSFLASFSKT